jgi:N-methylhydantoinase A/oxoprolinase/acetone carboxylase beta subunit
LHRERYGFVPEAEIEVVALHARAETSGSPVPRYDEATRGTTGPRTRRAPLGGARIRILQRQELEVGQAVSGPCLIEELTGVTLIPSGVRAIRRGLGLILRLR